MAHSPMDDARAWAEALGAGGLLLELLRRVLARRKARRILRDAAGAVVQDPAGQAALQRALNAATETILQAHGRDFSALRKQLAHCEEHKERCEAENRKLEERVAVLEVARGLAAYEPGKP